jgi:hypothetical protein
MGHYRFRSRLETKQGFTAAALITYCTSARDVNAALRCGVIRCGISLRYLTSTFTHYCYLYVTLEKLLIRLIYNTGADL